ncbi:MAG: class I SAM-dependent methyltransferase [Desulfuromonadales bacterium]
MEKLDSCTLCCNNKFSVIDPACNICRCETCGYVFDNPRPESEEIIEYYSKPMKYESWLVKEDDRNKLWQRRLIKVLAHKKSGTLLDVGAGTGQFLNIAKKYFTDVYGTEVSESAVHVAHDKYGLELIRSQIEDADFDAVTFDNICMFHVLEHVPNPRSVLLKCRDLLAPEGILFIAVPNEIHSLRNIVRRLLNRSGISRIRYSGVLGIPLITLDGSLAEIHLSHFSPGVLEDVMAMEGFTILETGLDPYFVSSGVGAVIDSVYFLFCRVIYMITGLNLYETMWIVARKQ